MLHFWVKIWNQKPKITLHAKLKLNPSKNKQTMTTFHFLCCRDIKMTIMTSYVGTRDDVINFFLISQDFYPSHIPTKCQHHLTRFRKNFWKICLFDHVFSQALPINWLLWQQWMTYPQTFNFKRWPIYWS